MGKALSADEVRRYEEQGYLCPVPALDDEEVRRFAAAYDEYEASLGEERSRIPPRDQHVLFSETHVFLPWMHEMATRPRVLDAVEAILGPDLLIWNTRWFTKRPGDKTFITWHQDGNYWALDPPKVATAWIALSPSTDANGCMRVVPGSQSGDMLPHRDTFAADNALSRGQEIAVEVDEAEAVSLVLAPGEMSLHHVGIVHGSRPNTSQLSRVGVAVRFIAPEVRQDVESAHAMLVRGEDRHGNFTLLEPPTHGTPDQLAERRREVVARMHANLMPPGYVSPSPATE
jgi:ectoine hydroxylase-related dioxygenase (phytanoyl-CoA dioxygenase family)